MSSNSNRPRPRSSKKQRARQGGATRTATQRAKAGPTKAGGASSGISTGWLIVIGVAVFALGAALAGGAIQFGGGGKAGASPKTAASVRPIPTGCPTSQPAAAPPGETQVATIETAKGSIEITLRADLSPIAVGNFSALAGCGFYDGIVFHRAATLQDGTPFVIQGGDPTGTGAGGPGYTIADEPVTAMYVRGTVAMARGRGANSVGSQFFIVLDDKDQSVLASANTYQIIGSVTAGMETADAIYADAAGQESPANPIAMTKVTVGPWQAAAPSPSVAPSVPPSAAPAASASPSPPASPIPSPS